MIRCECVDYICSVEVKEKTTEPGHTIIEDGIFPECIMGYSRYTRWKNTEEE